MKTDALGAGFLLGLIIGMIAGAIMANLTNDNFLRKSAVQAGVAYYKIEGNPTNGEVKSTFTWRTNSIDIPTK